MAFLVFWFCFAVLRLHMDTPNHGFPTFLLLSHSHADSPVFSLCSSSEAKTLGLPPSSLPTSLFAYFCLAEKYPCVFTGLVLTTAVSLVAGGETHEAEREPLNMDHLSLYPHGSLRALGWGAWEGARQVQ